MMIAKKSEQPSYGDESPIAAQATAAALSALALVRLSGKGTLDLLAKVFSRPRTLACAKGNTIIYGWIVRADTHVRIDEVLVSVYRAPASYTGEEGADISCHGGLSTVRAVMEELLQVGFRQALRGEFTFRAFFNGKLDLTRAEAVMEIVAAKSEAGRANAIGRLSGVLEARIQDIKVSIVRALAETELNLDYSELDGIGDESGALPARATLEDALEKLDALEKHYAYEKLCRDGALAVIAGKPNAGKSSLFNLLAREERAIVSDTPGTTRDWIESWISLDGIPVRLIDTAGLRESGDSVEIIGIERSRNLIQSADIVLYLLDGANFRDSDLEIDELRELKNCKKLIIIWNKADIAPKTPSAAFLPVSAKTGEGVSALCAAITTQLASILDNDERSAIGIGTDRQKQLIDTARLSLRDALLMADAGEPLDLIAPALREAVNALGMINGEVSSADILETMFSQFCVGK
ncbi:MAG: tRNA uridine-5-carboxymethylaminomethyl(34) synthesis GTPase MnmE [Spirochaetaceae bacterium]|jgi:tRNA modification GTPase|nr:tRNA uridine-5-carboxymethylaminomethyl(34) synthesis GTPase MnmE [Spirochaetaceae bacterium]